MKTKTAIIFDMDGTLSDPTHRRHFMIKPKNWKAWNAGMVFDTPHLDVINLAHMYKKIGHKILISTGREIVFKYETQTWMDNHKVPYDAMYMRPAGDHRDDATVKSELLDQILADGYQPLMVFDDRDRVVKMWRDRGLRCFQVNYGDF